MAELSTSERELVALGSAMGSNCMSCIEFHIPAARKAGLSEGQITTAIRLADKVRQVPAKKIMDLAMGMMRQRSPEPAATAAPQAAPGKAGEADDDLDLGCGPANPDDESGGACCG